jgi:tetratricopeptide (TPR) repeat protein
MTDLRQLLYEKECIGKVLDLIRKQGIPDPQADPERAILYAYALYQYGDLGGAKKVYSAVPPDSAHEAERLWGLASVSLRMGDLKAVKRLLAKAVENDPEPWLLARTYNTRLLLYLHEGDLEGAQRAYEQGLKPAEGEPSLTMRWILEGNLGAIQNHQGMYEEALKTERHAVRQLQARDCVLSTGHFLVNLGITYEALGDLAEAERCLLRADHFIAESGSLWRRVYLCSVQGEVWEKMGLGNKSERAYAEAGDLLRDLPFPDMEIALGLNLAVLAFKKGDATRALALVRDLRARMREKSFTLPEDIALFQEGRILVRTGAVEEGLKALRKAGKLAEARQKVALSSSIRLYLALAHEELKQRNKGLEEMSRALEALERSHAYQELLEEREALVSVLLRLVDRLPLTGALSVLIVRLCHPGLTKRLLRRSPEGKLRFVSALKVHDARHFRASLSKLRADPAKEVRRTTRLLLSGWQNQVSYRAYTLGGLRVLLEGRSFTDRDWMRPAAKRLFLYFLSQPGEWHPTEKLITVLWTRPGTERTPRHLKPLFAYLRILFEPWHLPDMDYVFFQSRRGAYGFFPGDRFWMDDQEFERGIKKAEKDQLARDFREARKAYREVLDLYLGDFLEESPYEDWLRPKRDYLRELYFRGVLRYATLERESGNLPEARRVLEEALFKDLSRCECMALLIQVLAQMKLSQRARDWGDRHVKYLRKELREKPAPEVLEALGKLG